MTGEVSSQQKVQFTAPNGVIWTRQPGGTSTGAQLLEALSLFGRMNTDVALLWNWWEEGRHKRENDRVWGIVEEWDNGAPGSEDDEEDLETFQRRWREEADRKIEVEKQRRADLVARSYDKERVNARLRLLRKEADAAFFQHVIDAPATAGQREDAERRLEESRAEAKDLRQQVGEPDDIVDEKGYLPAERRKRNLDQHMRYWRYPMLRELQKQDRRRFKVLLGMPAPDVTRMCSECQAPAEWHEYDLSLRLFRSQPAPGSTAETLGRLMPGLLERCPACTAYQIGHVWGGKHALPDFTGDQWCAMLPPMLRAIFAPDSVKKKAVPPKPKPLATVPPGPIADVMAKLQELQAKYPTAEVRQGARGRWELWPQKDNPKP